jgi:hypothetical protein
MRVPEPGKAVFQLTPAEYHCHPRLAIAERKLFACATSNCLIFRPDQAPR